MNSDSRIEPEAMTKTQLANLFKVCPRTLAKWLKPFETEIGEMTGKYIFTPAQVKIIFNKIGEP